VEFPHCAATVKVRKLTTSFEYPEQEKMITAERRKALDLSHYHPYSSLAIATDLTAAAHETAFNEELDRRIVPFTLVVDGTKVVHPQLGNKDVTQNYSTKTKLDRAESEAGLKTRDVLLSQPPGTLTVWLSPPGGPLNYSEGRLVIGRVQVKNKTKVLDSYGICLPFNSQGCLEIAQAFNSLTSQPFEFSNLEDLRSQIFVINNQENPWPLLRAIVPLPKVWDSIENGEAKALQEQSLKVAQQIAEMISPLLSQAQFWPLRSH